MIKIKNIFAFAVTITALTAMLSGCGESENTGEVGQSNSEEIYTEKPEIYDMDSSENADGERYDLTGENEEKGNENFGETGTDVNENETNISKSNYESDMEKQERFWEKQFGIEGLKITCSGYGEPDFDEEFSDWLLKWREDNNVLGEYFHYGVIGENVIISAHSGAFAGNAQSAFVIVYRGGSVTVIDEYDITNIMPIYFAHEDRLYCCDSSLSSGFQRFIYAEFDLESGEKIKECGSVNSLGDTSDRYESTDPEIDSMEKLKEHICEVSGEWYTLELHEWERLY
ncbi:MAG: hypothetical protein K2K57_00025 [Oscillospiraceae bacterium]|nr:hypothetical protein [Oscillospiraceae bacterium]